MPDNEEQDGDRTVPEAEYKKLQRKLNKVTAKWQDSEARNAEMTSAATRTESMVEGLADLVAGSDVQLKTKADDLVKRNAAQRGSDTSAAQGTARLEQKIDAADEDWEDTKFDLARRRLEEINDSGDHSRLGEVERLIDEAIAPSEEDVDARIEAAVAKALLGDKQERTRVDNTTSTAIEGKVRFSDLAAINPSTQSPAEMAEINKKALDQMFKE